MALLGNGVLAIWNGTTDAAEAEFVRWHVREHIPERVGLPGFLRGRRYVAVDGHPRYFNFYETVSTEVLNSQAYRDRLNDPTPWTRRVVSEFRETTRTVCDVAASLGLGTGGWIETIRLGAVSNEAEFRRTLLQRHLPAVIGMDGIVAAHLLRGSEPEKPGGTEESALRGEPDRTAAWVILVEGVDEQPLHSLRKGVISDEVLRACGAQSGIERGIYRLQFALAKAELPA
jgi:hypothetical protein